MWDIGLNYRAIAACVAAQAAIGMLWYSKALFGKPWLILIGKSEDDIKKGNPAKAIACSIVGAFITAYVMALIVFATGAATAWDGLQIGVLVWIGFCAVPYFNAVLFAGQSFKLYAINSGFDLAVFLAMSEILTLWI